MASRERAEQFFRQRREAAHRRLYISVTPTPDLVELGGPIMLEFATAFANSEILRLAEEAEREARELDNLAQKVRGQEWTKTIDKRWVAQHAAAWLRSKAEEDR